MASDTDSMELIELEGNVAAGNDQDHRAVERRRATIRRACAGAAAVLALVAVLAVLPIVGVTYPHSRAIVPSLTAPSETLLQFFGITPVLIAVSALTIVALIRKLPYAIGSVISLVVGTSLTTAAVRTWADGAVPASALPSGYAAAALSLICASTLVASARFAPMIWGLGTVAAVAVAGAAVVGGSASVVGVTTTLLIIATWWAGSSAVMVYSPVAAEREAQNPLDTAAMALRRR